MKKAAIGERIDDFIAYKRSLGYVYDTQERYLKHYQRLMEEQYPHLNLPDKASTDVFLDKYRGQPGGMYNAMAPLREFARYLFQLGYRDAYIVPPKQMPKLYPEPPYFFSEEELSVFFGECDSYYAENPGPLARGIVMPALFRILYCCGLRPKEARMLPAENVHLDKKYIDILQSKGPKSRRIYISDELDAYLICYDRRISAVFPERKYFFPVSIEEPYSKQALSYNFGIIWKKAFPAWEGNLPRIYDFRHHFAWATINRWAREGTDVNAMIPYLMRYMGHNCIKHTLYYFRFVPDFYADYKSLSYRLNDRIPEVPDE
ncbi:MAG: tyrosine-type recombinase/integrase [Clostridiales bacterium]|nr:tyrosine-type recombinase/integrase [Clostridiales bacterium]